MLLEIEIPLNLLKNWITEDHILEEKDYRKSKLLKV